MSAVRDPKGARRSLAMGIARSVIEAALLAPVLMFLILVSADIARGYAIQVAVQNGARAGVEEAALDSSPTAWETEARARDEMSRTPGMDSTVPTVTVTFAQSDGTTCASAHASPCFATVRVRTSWQTMMAWPLIPNTFTFDRATVMRMESY